MKNIKVMLMGIAIMVFGGPFLLGGGTGTIIGLVSLFAGIAVSIIGFLLKDDKEK